jgi:hypothetical protein
MCSVIAMLCVFILRITAMIFGAVGSDHVQAVGPSANSHSFGGSYSRLAANWRFMARLPKAYTACLRRREHHGVKTDEGNLHVRFDEGRVGRLRSRSRPLSYSTGSSPFHGFHAWFSIQLFMFPRRQLNYAISALRAPGGRSTARLLLYIKDSSNSLALGASRT